MFVYTVRHRRGKTLLLLVALLAATGAVLGLPQAAANGVRRGLAVCGSVMIPSLFPFLVLGGFVVRSGVGDSIGRRLSRVTRVLFRLPGCCAAGILIGFIGGYPAGAAAVEGLVGSGRITRAQGSRMLLFCVNGGPAFVLSAVGVGLLGNAAYGWLLLVIHWGVALLIGLIGRGEGKREPDTKPAVTPSTSASAALVEAVGTACRSLLSMCGFVMAASCVLSLCDAAGLPDSLSLPLSCLLEVSCGCVAAAGAGAGMPFWVGFALGWGGLSVQGQVAACVAAHNLLSARFFLVRLFHGLLSGILSLWLFRFVPVTVSVFSAAGGLTVQPFATSSAVGGLALLGVCVVYLLTMRTRRVSES